MRASSPKRLLLVKLGAIGDVVMAIPAARAMHRQGYEIHWVCGEAVAPLLALYPWIKTVPADEKKLLRSGKGSTLRELIKLWRRLPAGHYDVCATFYYDSRYKLLTLPVRARRKILLSKADRALELLPGRHHTDEYARILLAQIPLDYANGETPSQLAPIPAENLPPNPLPSLRDKPRIVLVPAGARNLLRDDALRRWPLDNYVALAALLLARGCEVVLCGGPSDVWASPAFAPLAASSTPTATAFTDTIGKLSLLETLALLDSAAVTITHDTGPLHLAGITRTAILALFGPTDPRGRLPQRSNCVALWGGEGFACRPCYDGRDYAPCASNGCLQQITPAMALAEAETLLTALAEGRTLPPRIRVPQHTPVQVAPLPAVAPEANGGSVHTHP